MIGCCLDYDCVFLSSLYYDEEKFKNWKDTINHEIKTNLEKRTWKVVDKNEGYHVIGAKMVLTENYV